MTRRVRFSIRMPPMSQNAKGTDLSWEQFFSLGRREKGWNTRRLSFLPTLSPHGLTGSHIWDSWSFLAGPLALATWPAVLHHTKLFHFIDNDSAAACLVKGYSPQVESSPLVGDYWLKAAAAGLDVYIDRVESKSNLADGPSRLNYQLVHALGGKYVPPPTGFSIPTLHSFSKLDWARDL